jgi:hypothetical protein
MRSSLLLSLAVSPLRRAVQPTLYPTLRESAGQSNPQKPGLGYTSFEGVVKLRLRLEFPRLEYHLLFSFNPFRSANAGLVPVAPDSGAKAFRYTSASESKAR